MNDRVSRLDLEITENNVVEKPHMEEVKSTKPEVVQRFLVSPVKKRHVKLLLLKVKLS